MQQACGCIRKQFCAMGKITCKITISSKLGPLWKPPSGCAMMPWTSKCGHRSLPCHVRKQKVLFYEQRNEGYKCMAVHVVLSICLAGMNRGGPDSSKKRTKRHRKSASTKKKHSRATKAFGSSNNTEYFLSVKQLP